MTDTPRADQPAGTRCPVCGQEAQLVISAQQAFCGNNDCRALMWDPSQPAGPQLANPTEIPSLLRTDLDDPGR